MAISINPKVVTSDLSLYIDTLNEKSFKGVPTTNFVNYNPASATRYNNPGFSGNVIKTSDFYKGSPIWELSFIPQAASYIPRLGSTEGFGCYHPMGTVLHAPKKYMASIYFKTDYPLYNNVNEGFSNTYSNIVGWGFENTGYLRYKEDGWTRLYTKWGVTSEYITRDFSGTANFIVNTTSTQNVIVSMNITSAHMFDFNYLYAVIQHNPTIANNDGLTGLSILNHGTETTNWTKLSYPSNIKLKDQLPYTYYFLLSVPSTGGINKTISLRPYPREYLTATSDNKFWKITFNVDNLQINDVIKTYWACPMIEETTGSYPSLFTIGTREVSESIVDLSPSKNTSIIVNDVTFNNGSELGLIFDGIDDAAKITYNNTNLNGNPVFSISSFIKRTGRVTNGGYWGIGGDANLNGLSSYTLTDNKITIDLTGTERLSTNVDYPLNQYVNVVWVKRSGYFNADNVSIYINGVEYTGNQLSTTSGRSHTPNLNTSTKGIVLGTSSTETSSFYVPGVISLFRVYNKALSSYEIGQNYTAIRSRFNLPPL